ncbi:MAG: RagB/SusD family nutrient uptake outer membrane protein [Pseudobacter sp.]|uniref:RagB/SusD family nutrient uptake outer membrane protein n=1 Tax=Pseudobacter sp. TaxID=2045420 RepID=UPI003F7E3136
MLSIISNINRKMAAAAVAGSCIAFQACKKAVEVPPPTNSLVGSTVFANDKTATAVMTGLYNTMHSAANIADGTWSIGKFMATAADELNNHFIGVAATQFYRNDLSSNPGTYFWGHFFKYIYISNSTLEGVEQSTTLKPAVKQQLQGEARFMRAFINFYAVNLYGNIPIVTTTDYKINNRLERSPQAEVYKLIVEDLLEAKKLLREEYMDANNLVTTEKIRPNRAAATAMLARVYLYLQDWRNAELQATELIGNASYELLPLNRVFLKNSAEAIWQLASSNPIYTNTMDGYFYTLRTTPGISFHNSMTNWLFNAFETGDARKTGWVGSYNTGTTIYNFASKYKNSERSSAVTEYFMVLRLAEQYLIRAEARAQQDKATALDDLNEIRDRANLDDYNGPTDKNSVLKAIQHERQVELFTEWGHRWFDLKRTGALDALMSGATGITAQKGGNWNKNDTILPLPLTEIAVNPKLTQNNGYDPQ